MLTAAQAEMRGEIAASGWWRRRSPGGRSTVGTLALGCLGSLGMVVLVLLAVGLSFLIGTVGAILFAIVVPPRSRCLCTARCCRRVGARQRPGAAHRRGPGAVPPPHEGRHVEWAWRFPEPKSYVRPTRKRYRGCRLLRL